MKHQRCLTREEWSGPDRSRCSRAGTSHPAREAWPQGCLAPGPPRSRAASLLSCSMATLSHKEAVCTYRVKFPSSPRPTLGTDSWWCWTDTTTISRQYPNMLLLRADGEMFFMSLSFHHFWNSVLQLSAPRFIYWDAYHSIIYNIKNENHVRVSK